MAEWVFLKRHSLVWQLSLLLYFSPSLPPSSLPPHPAPSNPNIMIPEDGHPLTKEEQFQVFYRQTLQLPFKENYEEKWQEEPYWAAVEVFKAQVKEIGYDDPLERLKSYPGRETFEKIRDDLKVVLQFSCARDGPVPILARRLMSCLLLRPSTMSEVQSSRVKNVLSSLISGPHGRDIRTDIRLERERCRRKY